MDGHYLCVHNRYNTKVYVRPIQRDVPLNSISSVVTFFQNLTHCIISFLHRFLGVVRQCSDDELLEVLSATATVRNEETLVYLHWVR